MKQGKAGVKKTDQKTQLSINQRSNDSATNTRPSPARVHEVTALVAKPETKLNLTASPKLAAELSVCGPAIVTGLVSAANSPLEPLE